MGTGPGLLTSPHGITLLRDGSGLLVASRDADCVSLFALDGSFARNYGPIAAPYALAESLDAPGEFYVGSWSKHEVYRMRRSTDSGQQPGEP